MRTPLVALCLSLLASASCRDASEKAKEDKPPLSAECAAYVEQANACVAKNEPPGKHALESVRDANMATIDEADTAEKMAGLVKQCTKWTELLGNNPKCK